MKYLKPTLKYLSFLLIGLFIALALTPYVFKDKILQYLRDDINASLRAKVSFGEIDLTIIKSFPDLRISIDSLSVVGIDDFEDIVLYRADRTALDIHLPSLFGKNMVPRINAITLDHPEINIVTLDSIRSNYRIVDDSDDSEEGKYTLQLKHYELNQAKITYQDNTMPFFMMLDSLNHSGSGDFTQDIFELKTKSTAKRLYVKYDGTAYVNNVTIDLDANIEMNLPEMKFTLSDNILKFNELNMTADGFLQLGDEDIMTDFKFKTASEDFKSFLSIVPNAYTKDFAQVKTSGKAAIQGQISGIYNADKALMPIFDIQINIDNGAFQYPALPQDIKQLYADLHIKTTRPDYKDLFVNIPQFRMLIGNEPISGNLIASNLTGNQQVKGALKGTLNLSQLAQAFPIQDLDMMKGTLNCDIAFDAKMSDINAERYDAITFSGTASAKDVHVKMKDKPAIKIGQVSATASPAKISFVSPDMELGKSDMNIAAEIKNPLAFFSTEKNMKIDVKATSKFLDLDEWMDSSQEEVQGNSELGAVAVDEDLLRNSDMELNLQFNRVKMNGYELKPLNMNASVAANAMHVRNFDTSIEGSDIHLTGNVVNAYDYLMKGGILDGQLNLSSRKLNLNTFMTDSPSTTNETPLSVIPVPERVRVQMRATVGEIQYTNLVLKEAAGDLEVNNKEVVLHDFDTKILGGSFGLQGYYSTVDITKPEYSLKLDMKKIKYSDAFNSFNLFQKVAPIAQYLDGFFNTSLVIKGVLGQDMMPLLNTVDASGLIETLNGTIKGIDPLGQLSSLLGIKELSNIDLVNTRNWFEIANGFVEIKEFTKHIKGIDMTMSGRHGINQDMDYKINLVIPRELLQGNKITGAAESGLKMLEKEASKLGVNLDQGPNIYLDVIMTGNLKSPKFKITPKSGQGKSMQNELKDKGQETLDKMKDTIQKEIEKQKEILKDTITKRLNQEADKAKSKIEEASQKALDSLKNKAKSAAEAKLDSIAKGVISDSLKQKTKDVIEKGVQEEIDKIKDKLKDFNPFKNKKKN